MFTRTLKTGVVAGIAFAALSLGGVSQAHATPVSSTFSDDFDTTTTPSLNQYNFDNFTVSSGSVDVIGTGTSWDFHPGNGLYVDLCGSTNQCGGLTTKETFGPGTYKVTLGLGGIGYAPGNGYGATEANGEGVNVSFGSSSTDFLAPAWNATDIVSEVVSLNATSTLTIADLGLSGDQNIGTNLLSVSVSPVPLPGAMPMFGAALLGLVGLASRRARRVVS